MSSRLTEILKDVYDRTALVKHINALTGGTNAIAAAVVTAGGTGYSDSFAVTFTGGGGSGAAGTATALDGVIVSIAITAAGTGYTSAPTPVPTAGGGSGGTAVAVLGAETLDAVTTADVDAGTLQLSVVVSGALYHYDLVSGTDAESSPAIIRPDDYATTTNEKVWSRISPYSPYIKGAYAKANTQAATYPLMIRSDDTTDPLELALGIKTDTTASSRLLLIDAREGSTARLLHMQPSGGKISVGTLADKGRLTIKTGESGQAAYSTSGDELVLEAGGNVGVTLMCPSANTGFILFADEGDVGAGQIRYAHTGDVMSFYAAGGEKCRFNSGGNFGLGVTSFGTSAAGVLAIANGTQGAALANAIQIVSEDLSAGNTIPSIRTEGSGIYAAGTPAAATGSIAIKINGTVYHFTVSTTAAS